MANVMKSLNIDLNDLDSVTIKVNKDGSVTFVIYDPYKECEDVFVCVFNDVIYITVNEDEKIKNEKR